MTNIKVDCDKRKIYYVYEWFVTETNEVFYVGKGSNNRFRKNTKSSRNNIFMDFTENNNCDVRKIVENLDEYSACVREEERIKELKQKNECKANMYDRTSLSGRNYGEKNGFYGKRHSDEYYKQLAQKFKDNGTFSGKNNPQYGITPKERMSKKVYEGWKNKHKEKMIGKKNCQFGISVKERMKDEGRYKKFCQSCARGNMADNPNAKPIIMIDENKNIKTFSCIKECALFLIEQKYTNAKGYAVQSSISGAINKNKTYLGFIFEKVKKNEL